MNGIVSMVLGTFHAKGVGVPPSVPLSCEVIDDDEINSE